jgi:hypothetical protein
LYNYADDNTLSYVNDNYEKLIDILEKESSVLIDWFKFNCMQANPDKFQAIAVGNKTHAKTPVFKIDSVEITCDEVVKLLGIDIDYQLNFNYHIINYQPLNRNESGRFGALKSDSITKLPNSEQSYKGKVKTHNYINRQNQSTTGKL